jgi:PAS domain S-box-containing protein
MLRSPVKMPHNSAVPTRKNSRLLWFLVPGVVIPALLLGVNAILAREFAASERQAVAVARSFETRAQLRLLLSLHQDIETGQRGYVLTGNRAFLQPYEQARGRIDGSFGALETLAAGNALTMAALPGLRAASRAKLETSDRDIALVRQGRSADAQALIAGGEGRRRMDTLRSLVQRIDTAESAQLARRTAASNDARRASQRMALLLNAGLIVLLGLAAFVVLRALQGRARALDRAEDQAARQAAVFESAKDAMLTINPSGSIETLNPAAARLFGHAPDELMRRDVGILFEVAPDRGRIESFLKRLRARSADRSGNAQEFWARRRDGSTFLADVTLSPVLLADGHRYLAVLRDVTERKQVERMKTEFVSTVSHELRTPLTSIAGSLGLLSGGAAGTLPDRAARLVDIAYNNCQRLVRLINDILDIEKIESGQMRFDNRAVDLAGAVDASIQANSGFAETHRVTVAFAAPGGDPVVIADPDRLAQVVTNLLSNAIKFSPVGGVVDVAILPLDRRYRLSIADRGPGVPAEFRNRIFGKFAQADSSDTRSKGGTGLGLSIVRELAVRMGGAVSFEDREGGGTIFSVDLPAGESVAPAAAPPPLPAQAGLPIVLHVDDDPDMLRVVAEGFDGRADIRSAKSVEAARSLIRAGHFDAAILDIGMADGSGLDLLPLLRERLPGAPVVVFTAQDAEAGLDARIDALFVKSRASLEKLVSRTLELCEATGTDPT